MKIHTLGAALAGLIAATPAFAGHEDHAGQADEAAPKAMAPCREDAAATMDRLLGSLPEQIEAIRETEDPQERQRLLRDHLVTMEEVLHLMGKPEAAAGNAPRPEKRADAAGEGRKREGHGMMGGGGQGMMAMHRAVEERLDRLQKLLQQMIEHELAEEGTDVD